MPRSAIRHRNLPGAVHPGRTVHTVRRILVAAVLCASVAGCDWWLRITEVSGTVTVDGKPTGGVQLVFEPVDRSRPRALARTGSDGTFSLGRQGPGDRDGAAAGEYVVRLMSDTDGGDGIRIPPRYNVRSELKFTVVPGRANTFDIDISTAE
jgi:hypothetical protein